MIDVLLGLQWGDEGKGKIVDYFAKDYDVVIVAVNHNEYKNLDDLYFLSITKPHALIADLKGCYRNKIQQRKYWSL